MICDSQSFRLDGNVVALSMSPPNDLGRLGYPPPEFDRLTFEFVLQILRSGGRVLYGGHIHEGSLALKMFEYLALSLIHI